MKELFTISKKQAVSLALEKQLLNGSNFLSNGIEGTEACIKHLGYVQIDTLSVIMRAHHHVLFTRCKDYKETYLDTLIQEKKIFEYWAHAAAFLPMKDFRFSLPRKMEFRNGKTQWFKKNETMVKFVRDRIKAEGPLQAKDFETEKKQGAWFDWKPAKQALEQLFQEGLLMISSRKGFQKVYDLTERVLPETVDTSLPNLDEYSEHLVLSKIRSQGFTSAKEAAYLRTGMVKPIVKRIRELIEEKKIIPLKIKDVEEQYYGFPELQNWKIVTKKQIRLLSPFDSSIIQRDKLKRIFDFDFQLECYVPEPKRKYGYFCLPILFNNQFVGRLDPKADRKSGMFSVKALHLETTIDTDFFLKSLANELKRFAKHHHCTEVRIEKTVPADLRKSLEANL
jgi:uncharacterized protein